jgi:hypothetical protein
MERRGVMNASLQSPTSWFYPGLLVVSLLITPVQARAADPMETICLAFRSSSKGRHSGIGKGKYRHYDAVPGGDWQLKLEANILAQFDGRKYHVDLTFDRDDLQKLDSRRLFYDGEKITVAIFTPRAHPTGAHAYVITPNDLGDGLARGAWGEFQWDVTNLARNVWDPDRLMR